VLVLSGVLSDQRLYAQSACAQLGVDCSHHSTHQSMPSTQQIMQREVAETVVNAFMRMLFSNDSQAKAQKQKMLAELQARQLAAERQKMHDEAIRLAAIMQRLQATLKLSGTPALNLKSETVGGGLQIKLGEPNSGHVGVPGLPGIALNDNTGNGGTTPYGIAGLPGIYTNGPATPATAPSGGSQPANGGLQLKLGDGPSVAQTTTPTAAAPANAVQATTADPRTMSPQQLADVAANLSPEQQQQLANAIQAAQSSGATQSAVSAPVAHLSPTTTVSAGTTPTTTEALNSQGAQDPVEGGQSAGANSPAFGQLRGTAAASQRAATATSPEGMAAGAREGFDTAAGGSAAPVRLGGNGSPQTTHGSTQAGNGTTSNNGTSASTDASAHSKPGSTGSYPVVDMSVLKPPPPMTNASSGTHAVPNAKPQCVKRTEHKLPSRQELLTELAQRRTELENLRRTIMRLNRSIQMDQKQFEMWQAEAEAGHERVVNRVISLPTKLALDSLIEIKETQFDEMMEKGPLSPAAEKQLRMLERAKDLKTFDDFQKWVLEEKSDPEMYEEGMRQLIAMLPFGPEVQSYVNCAQDLIDNAYDLVDLVNTWDNVQLLDHNSDRFLLGVKSNGERMRTLVTRIQQIESQLNGTPQNVQIEYCSR
jgi:hypothetical protein